MTAFTCTAGLASCTEERELNGQRAHHLTDGYVDAQGWRPTRYGPLEDIPVGVVATVIRFPDQRENAAWGQIDGWVQVVAAGCPQFSVDAANAQALGVSLILASYRLGRVDRNDELTALAARLVRPVVVAA